MLTTMNFARRRDVLYLTRIGLMNESERTVHECATFGDELPRRVCRQLIADAPRYSLWQNRHADRMAHVAGARRRERQILALRSLAVEQVHRTALVSYLRDHHIVGHARDQTLQEFYRLADPRNAAVFEHRNYLLAASTQLCAVDILRLVEDADGLDLIQSYELAYRQYFGMFCERARAKRNGTPYLLATLLPEVRDAAQQLKLRILDSRLVPVRRWR